MILEAERLGPYRLVKIIGRGGMGVVYRAEHDGTGEVVALKTVRTVQHTEASSLRREIRALGGLQHPGVVAIRGTGQWSGLPWYAMELVQGQTLREWHDSLWSGLAQHPVDSSPLTLPLDRLEAGPVELPPPLPRERVANGRLPEVLTLVRRLLAPLAYLHARGLVHRDLKPANIFVRPGLRPVLADFGLAREGARAGSRDRVQEDWIPEGTPAYMAPEAIRGELTDARADLYAVGVVLFELCAHGRPFVAADDAALVHLQLNAPAPLLSERVTGVPAPLEEIVEALLQKSAGARPGDATDVMRVLESLGAEPDPDEPRLPASAPIYRPRLAGREGALRALAAVFDRLRRGEGGIVLVGGRSGIGKTHLVNEAARRVRAGVVVAGRCESVGPLQRRAAGLPLHPLRPLLERVADRCAADPLEAERVLRGHGRVLAPYAPRLGALPGVMAEPPPVPLAGSAERERLFGALRSTLEAMASSQALVVLLDDIQWSDELTLDFLASLPAAWLSQNRVVFAATWRTNETTDRIRRLLERRGVDRVELDELDGEAVESVVRDMLAVADAPDDLVRAVLRASEGSPFYIAEYLRAAVLEGHIRRRGPEGIEVGPGALELLLPASDLLSRRLGLLGERERQFVKVACVFGRSFEPEVVGAVLGWSEEQVLDALNELLARQVLVLSELGGVQFAHDQLVERAYAELVPEERHRLNGAVAAATERAHPDLRGLHAELAHHWREAQDRGQTLRHLGAAADEAFGAAAYDAARAFLEELLTLDAAESPARQRAAWEQRLGECAWYLGDLDGAERWTRRAFGSLGHALPTSLPGWLARLAFGLVEQGLHRFGLVPFATAEPEAREDLRRLGVAANVLCWRFLFKDDLVGVGAMALLGVNWVERGRPRVPMATAYGWLAYNVGVARLRRLAESLFERARADARSEDDQPGWTFALLMEAIWHASFGRWADLERISLEAIADLEGQGDPQNVENHLTDLATGEHLTGRFANSTAHFERILASARERGNAQHTAWGLYGSCWGLIGEGRLHAALPRLEEAWTLLLQNADAPSEILTASMLALVRLRLGDRVGARIAADQARVRVARMRGAVYPVVPGYVALADALTELAWIAREEGGDAAGAVQEARVQLRYLWVLTLLFPFCRPIYDRCRATLLAVRGLGRARAALRAAAEACTAGGLPYEAAQAWWSLGRHFPEERAEAWTRARAGFEAVGARWFLSQMEG